MKRWLYIALCGALAYALLSGATERFGLFATLMLAVLLVIAVVAGIYGFSRKSAATIARCQRHFHNSDRIGFAAAGFAALSFLLLFFLHAPPALEQASDSLLAIVAPEKTQQTQQIEAATSKTKAQSGNWLWTDQTIRPLPRRARLRPGSQPEIFLQLQEPRQAKTLITERAYVSAFALGTYENAAWSLTPADTTSMPRYSGRYGTIFDYEIFHPSDPSGQTPIAALQGLRDAEIAPLSYRGDGVTLLPPMRGTMGYRYRARSQPLSIDDLTDDAKAMPRTRVPAAWLTLPEQDTLEMGIRGLNAESVTLGNLRSQLQQIRASLQAECRYSLDILNPDNIDPLENFLLHEKSGHCEMFATAGVMCARALGVPARIAYGWTGGSYYESSNLFVFRAREAHAWTEVLIEDVGWVVMDCTPAEAIGASRTAPPQEKPLADLDKDAELDQESATMVDRGLLNRIFWSASAFFFLAGLALLWWRPQQRDSIAERSAHSTAAPSYLRQFLLFCGKHKLRAHPGSTVRMLLAALPLPPRFADALLRYHYQTRYGRQQVDRVKEQELSEQIRREME